MTSKQVAPGKETPGDELAKRKYLVQSDVPAYSLKDALRIPRAIADHYGKSPTRPLPVAQAMELTPASSRFRMLCGASAAYGLTDGSYKSDQIALTPLGRRIVAPTKEGDDRAAMREATLRPRVVRDFLTRYNGSKLPSATIGMNVLGELGVPEDRTQSVYELIVESAKAVGFLREVKGQAYVDLDSSSQGGGGDTGGAGAVTDTDRPAPIEAAIETLGVGSAPARTTNRVFITHGQNQDVVAQLKDLLTFGGFTPVVAIETESISKPVPDKVMDEMRDCQAAVIHVGAERRCVDQEGKEHRMLNENVLIEIGAAMALYDRKFILLVEKGATLPSNLHGLYQVRYDGGKLDYESTMKLLKAFNDFRAK